MSFFMTAGQVTAITPEPQRYWMACPKPSGYWATGVITLTEVVPENWTGC